MYSKKNIALWLKRMGVEGVLKEASSDASFRKYYRLTNGTQSSIVMDASQQKEVLVPFIEINSRLATIGVRVPKVLQKNLEEGYLIVEDMGNQHLFDVLNSHTFEPLYRQAIDTIVTMQQTPTEGLPPYDKAFLKSEMELMEEWYVNHYLGVTLTPEQQNVFQTVVEHIANEVLGQPQGVFVHRDFHSRNIMLTPHNEMVVIDFQDARVGAITYDLVSLLRDCYIAFQREDIERLALYFKEKKGLHVDDATFLRWFDFMGLQRHIKVLGIFARLALRDNKEAYLKDIPLTLKYVLEVANRYKETQHFVVLLEGLQQ
jgi:aminoglycoside/choline kinase family phosphotransferase